MKIGIFGCSHSFGSGVNLSATIKSLYTKQGPHYQNLETKGYPVILSKLYPQHDFEVIPALCAGNLDIILNLTDCIQNNPKDLYIVQTTQWHRSVIGVLPYHVHTISVTDNLKYTTYEIDDIDSKGPNLLFSFLPHSGPHLPIKGTGFGGFDFHSLDEKRRLAFINASQILMYDHIESSYFLNQNKKVIDQLYYLSTKENIWYFHWNPVFGNKDDFKFMDDSIKQSHAINMVDNFYKLWYNKDHKKQIINDNIEEYFFKKFGKKDTIVNFVTDAFHFNNEAHEIIVNKLLKNKQFKEALDG